MKNHSVAYKVIALFLSFLILSIPLLAQQENPDTFYKGKIDGESDAKGNPLWILAGLIPPIGNFAAYQIKPNPPAPALIGKSPEYVKGYTQGYKNKSRVKNLRYTLIGTGVVVVAVGVAVIIASNDNGSDCGIDFSKPCSKSGNSVVKGCSSGSSGSGCSL